MFVFYLFYHAYYAYYYIIILYFLYLPMEIYFNILVSKDFGTEYFSSLYYTHCYY